MEFTEEQNRVTALFKDGKNLLVTGPAGSGKSALLRELQLQTPGTLHITASTGIAAVNVGGMTIHSWAGIGLGDDKPRNLAARIMSRREAYMRVTRARHLAIDEISMLSAELFEKLDKTFQLVRSDARPFGGIQLLLFGDFLQLPPVAKKRGTKFAFESDSWKSAGIETIQLTKIFRQENLLFAEALNDIRRGERTELAQKLIWACSRRKDDHPEIKPVILHTHNSNADAINNENLLNISEELHSWSAIDNGDERGIRLLQQNCIAPDLLNLKKGAQVMLLVNVSPENGLANGSLGVVTGYSSIGFPIVRFENKDHTEMEVARSSWEIKEDGKVIATRSQVPLRLAYAITIHKSQGMQFDKAKVFLAKTFEYGQAYVALSRARTSQGLFVDAYAMDSVRAHPKALYFYGYTDVAPLDEDDDKQGELF